MRRLINRSAADLQITQDLGLGMMLWCDAPTVRETNTIGQPLPMSWPAARIFRAISSKALANRDVDPRSNTGQRWFSDSGDLAAGALNRPDVSRSRGSGP